MDIKYTLSALSELFFPRTCAVCGKRMLINEKHLCIHCMADLPLTYNWELADNTMSDSFNNMIQGHLPDDRKEILVYAASLIFFNSEAGYRHIPYRLKYQHDISIGRFFGKMLGERLSSSALYSDVDTVIPVPLHRSRKRKRGYNQSEILAKEIATALNAEMRTDLLKRIRKTETQTKLDIREKMENVHKAFLFKGDPAPGSAHILLVDDVFTTGATLYSCFQAIREKLPDIRISVATLAQVTG